jgi:hypothetical protein
MENQIYITLLTGFGGIILGFLLTQLGNYLQSYREDKRVLKQVLFNQLDIWVEMKRADVETLVPMLLDKFRNALLKRGAKPEDVSAMFAGTLTPLITILRSLKLAAPENLRERYQESVNQLAKVDPLLAYQLSGRPQTDFNETVDTFIERAMEFEDKKTETTGAADSVSHFTSFIKGYGQQKILSGMESDILDVAGHISYWTRFRTRRRLSQLTTKLADEADKYMDQFLDSLIQFTVQAQAHPAPPNEPNSDNGSPSSV